MPAEHSFSSLPLDQQDRFRVFMDHLPGIAWIKDANGRIVFMNRTYEQRYEVRLEDWRGKTDFDVWPADIAERFRRNDLAVLESGQPQDFLEETRDASGKQYYWWCQKFVIRDTDGQSYIAGTGVDVTTRQLSFEALTERSDILKTLLETSSFVILGMTPDHRVFEWNRAAERIYGWKREEVLGKDYLRYFLPEEVRAGVADEIRQLLNGRPTEAYANLVLHRDGSSRTLLWNACRLQNLQGEVTGLIALGQDITEYIETQNSLRESQSRLEFALDASHAGTWSWDIASNVSTWDRRYAELYELSPDDSTGVEVWLNRVHAEDRDRLQRRIQEMIACPGDDAWNVEFRTIPLSTGIRWMAGLGRLERDPHGRAVRFSGINLEITERKRAEAAARQSQAEIQALMDAFPDLYFWMEGDGTIRRYHGGFTPHVPATQFLGKKMQDVLPRDIGETIEQAIRAALATGTIQTAEYSLTELDGLHWYDARIAQIEDSQHVLMAIRDVTTRRNALEEKEKLQAQLQHAQKLESLGILAGGIAHDFNNILTGILGFADLALAELPADSAAKSHLEKVLTGAHRAADLTRQMLAYAGKGPFVVGEVDLSEIVREIGPLVQLWVSKRAVLRQELADNLPSILGDAAQLRQLVMNLIINASDALQDQDGEITIQTAVRNYDRSELMSAYLSEELSPGNVVVLEVRDNGIGMNEETRRRIFDPFYTTKATGRGLGLAVVLGIVRGHHGAIDLVSDIGQGTTFRILLPIHHPTPAQPKAALPAATPVSLRGTALVVDDESSVRELAAAMLNRAGLKVITAPDGRAALRIFSQQAEMFCLVLLDLTMPHMSGEETFRELRKLNDRIPIIMTSGYNEQPMTDKPPVNWSAFLQKPYSYRELTDILARVL